MLRKPSGSLDAKRSVALVNISYLLSTLYKKKQMQSKIELIKSALFYYKSTATEIRADQRAEIER